MLSHDERRQLERLETWTSVDDPEFAEGLRVGCPRRPQEYRRWPAVTLLALGLALLLAALVATHWLPAVFGVAVTVAGGVGWHCRRRRLDGPSRRVDTPRWSWWERE